MPHFLTIQQLSPADILCLMGEAERYASPASLRSQPLVNTRSSLPFMAPLFFEDSTRTRISFEIAAKRLGFSVIDTALDRSSLSKGETLEDMALNLEALGCRVFVVRATEHETITKIAEAFRKNSVVINAGSGCDHHPSQALLDFFTIQKHFKNWEKLKIAIVGDIVHSRVAHSFLALCRTLKIADVRLIAPSALLPKDAAYPTFTDLKTGLANADVVMTLRIQNERISSDISVRNALSDYVEKYQINVKTMKPAAPHAIVMHPGPMNREVEISSEVADGSRSVILEQAQNGIFVRMAVLDFFAKNIL